MLRDLYTGECGSKRTGAEWAKLNLNRSFADLIDRAWQGRPNPAVSIRQPANQTDFRRTLELVSKVMDSAKRLAAREGYRSP